MWRKGNHLTLLVQMKMGAGTLGNSKESLQKIKNRTSLQTSNCTARYLAKEYKNTDSKGYMNPDVYSSIINNSLIMEGVQTSIN